jgi:hypothetical protein
MTPQQRQQILTLLDRCTGTGFFGEILIKFQRGEMTLVEQLYSVRPENLHVLLNNGETNSNGTQRYNGSR